MGGPHIHQARLLDGGLFNTTYHVTYGEAREEAVLRLGPVNRQFLMGHEENLIQSEVHICALCERQGIPSSHVLAWNCSRRTIDRDYMIVRYIPSVPMCRAELAEEERSALHGEMGAYLRRFHQIEGDCCGEAVRRAFRQNKALLDAAGPPRLLHTDLWEGNVLLDRSPYDNYQEPAGGTGQPVTPSPAGRIKGGTPIMKLAEALQLRADLQKRMEQLAGRLYDNATVQEGEQPTEDPAGLLAEYEDCAGQLEDLMARINRTNCETKTDRGTLTELLARRDCLKMRVETYRNFLTSASSLTRRATRSEIRIMSAVSVPEYRKKADALARELRETDNVIQSANWTTELL